MSALRGAVCVFVGPTLPAGTVTDTLPDAVVLPPAAQGDVYRAARERPRALAVVDGYFERVPSVWHKEVLWALREGIPVYGASSMGALRAAELRAFGMVGVGWIFEQFAAGMLTDDDEVAVAHTEQALGYRAASEAMVNIRRTLEAAAGEGVIGGDDADTLTALAKQRFYPERSWSALLEEASARGLADSAAALRAWLPHGRVDQKRLDALALLDLLRTDPPEPVSVPWTFQHTLWWDDLVRSAGPAPATGDHGALTMHLILEELLLEPEDFTDVYRGALIRTLASAEAERCAVRPDATAVRERANDLCTALGLTDQAAFDAWLAHNHLDLDGFNAMARTDAAATLVATRAGADVLAHLPDQLRATGRFGRLAARAEDKQRTLAAAGLENPSAEAAGGGTRELYQEWFDRHGIPVPSHVDRWAKTAGYRDEDAFRRVLAREAVYRSLKENV
ncbi:TfuA-like protein [Streptomyces sp. NPDC001455]|uniref:TfuA-like protein n=1 Tax=Streptomyces sp. NPDC001455 TaxID=3154518 RepID=UPI003316A4C7